MTRARTSATPGRLFAAVLLVVVGLLATACSSSKTGGGRAGAATTGATTGSSAATAPDTVVVKNFSFNPMSLTVPVGTTVTWKFEDAAPHTVSALDKSFASASLSSGQTYSFRFMTAGTYQYICSIHQYMKGSVTVR